MNEQFLSQLYLKDTAFDRLMQQRVHNVLLVASTYDAFILEEDGRVEEQLFTEYASLNLSSAPRVTRVSSYDEAREALAATRYDLIIAMPGVELSATFAAARRLRQFEGETHTPFVVLTPFSREVSRRLLGEDLSAVDYVFSWLGNVDLLLAIIKLLEDQMNARHDVLDVGLQMILLVEDSVRFYSSILPTIYKFLLRQSQRFSSEALNAHEGRLRMRGRPKVMLARDYEEAMALYEAYGENMLGVISDVSFKRGGEKDTQAGLKLAAELRRRDPYLPIIVESSDADNEAAVREMGCTFVDKNSKALPVDLGKAIMDNFGFGDFIIRDPDTGAEIMRLADLKALQYRMGDIPDRSLLYHAQRNDISRWLYSRAIFPIAQVIKMHRFVNIGEAPAVKRLFSDLIVKYRLMKNRGLVADFRADRFDKYSNFARIGQGSLGGKGRGLAFIDSIIKRHPECDNFDGITISIPHTVVLCTDVFDEFMEQNNLYPLALSDAPDEEILAAFQVAQLPEAMRDDFNTIYDVMDGPIAVRSSSLLEDSHYQPFAGIYATYMVPRLSDRDATVNTLSRAVKSVYASVFFAASKSYMTATSNVIDQEKMAVILQEVVGQMHGERWYYPSFSGVARSLNYYPIGAERPEDGVCELAVGLGKYIVDGGQALRFSPRHPHHVLQTSTLQLALRDTQTSFYALDCLPQHEGEAEVPADEGFNIVKRGVQQAGDAGELHYMVSTFDYRSGSDRLVHSDSDRGRRVVTFANVLDHGVFPLAKALDFMLTTGRDEMDRAVEVEFAGVLGSPADVAYGRPGKLYWLQIRPMVDRREMVADDVLDVPPESVVVACHKALGHGVMTGLRHVVLVNDGCFGLDVNRVVAGELAAINAEMSASGTGYVLMGVGRWGSSDEALGVPVRWADISQARVVVELPRHGAPIQPSQGTHFFQNLTSFGVGYFSVDEADECRLERITSRPVVKRTPHVTVYELPEPLTVTLNGQTGQAVITVSHPS